MRIGEVGCHPASSIRYAPVTGQGSFARGAKATVEVSRIGRFAAVAPEILFWRRQDDTAFANGIFGAWVAGRLKYGFAVARCVAVACIVIIPYEVVVALDAPIANASSADGISVFIARLAVASTSAGLTASRNARVAARLTRVALRSARQALFAARRTRRHSEATR